MREKWEAREQRALDEVDRLREDRSRWGDTDVIALTRQLEEAQEEQFALKEELSKYETMVGELKGQQEYHLQEKKQLEEELILMCEKVRIAEPRQTTDLGDSTTHSLSRGQLNVGASVFTPGPEPDTGIGSHDDSEVLPRTSPDASRIRLSTTRTPVRFAHEDYHISTTEMVSPQNVASATVSTLPQVGLSTAMHQLVTSGSQPTATTGELSLSTPLSRSTGMTTVMAGGLSLPTAGSHYSLSSGVPHVLGGGSSGLTSQPAAILSEATTVTSFTASRPSVLPPVVQPTRVLPSASVEDTRPPFMVPVGTSATSGFSFAYPMVPLTLPQIPNFHGGDQRDIWWGV